MRTGELPGRASGAAHDTVAPVEGKLMKKDQKKPTTKRVEYRSAVEETDRKVRRILTTIAVTAVVAIVAMTAIGMQQRSDEIRATTPNVDSSAPAPKGAFPADSAYAYGIPYGSNNEAPVFELWEDFQCPACKALEAISGKNIRQLADEGKILLVYRPVNFLDNNLGNTSSTDAANAFGCAVDAGVGADYHDIVYTNQPSNEGTGYSPGTLEAFAFAVGLTDKKLESWKSCFNNRTYYDWIANSMDAFTKAKLTGTPTIKFNGKVIDNAVVADPKKLAELVANTK